MNSQAASTAVTKLVVLSLSVAALMNACSSAPKITAQPIEMLSEEAPNGIHVRPNVEAAGMIEWFFHCRPKLTVKKALDGNHATITVQSADMDLGLTIKRRMPKDASQSLITHEQKHVEICQSIYKDAPAIAQRCCKELIGKEYTGDASSPEAAVDTATQYAAQDLCRAYLQQTARKADSVSDIYDRLTMHAFAKVDAQAAMRKAFEEAEADANLKGVKL